MFKRIHKSTYLLLAFVFLVTTSLASIQVSAQIDYDPNNKFLYPHYDPTIECNANANPLAGGVERDFSGALARGSSVYVMGDSLTVAAERDNKLSVQIEAAGYSVTKINANGGRALSVDTWPEAIPPESQATAFKAFVEDQAVITQSDAAVIALGTNSGTELNELGGHIEKLVGDIRAVNDDIEIYWVNVFSNTNDAEQKNGIIEPKAIELGLNIIDAKSAGIELDDDNIHTTVNGTTQLINTIIGGLQTGGSTVIGGGTPANSSGYNPVGLSYPTFPNETAIVNGINQEIERRSEGKSPFLSVGGGNFGLWLMQESKARNINPFLVVGTGRQENNYGLSDRVQVRQYFNYFGMKGSSPIDIPNSQYRGFSSPEEGILFFLDDLQENIYGPDRGVYASVTNMYEYFAMHQSGIIAYPGEPLDPNDVTGPVFDGNGNWVPRQKQSDGDTQNGYDPQMGVYTSWGPIDHPNKDFNRNQIFNPGIYYKNTIPVINEITGLNLPDSPVRGGANQIVNNCDLAGALGSGTGIIDSTGYVFPLSPQDKSVGGIQVGQTVTGHHDGTPAFDLFSTDSAEVYAIYSGETVTVRTEYRGIQGCSTIQLKADDGFYYWYGHLKEPTVKSGDRVEAGQPIAKIADDKKFGSDCWGGAPHLHIDRGCTINGVPQRGGSDPCRDPDFIPFLADIYSRL